MTLKELNQGLVASLLDRGFTTLGGGIREYHTGFPHAYTLTLKFDKEGQGQEWLDMKAEEIWSILKRHGITKGMQDDNGNGIPPPWPHKDIYTVTIWFNKERVDSILSEPETHA